MVNIPHAEKTAGAKGTPISKGTDVLSFWVNKIRFRTTKSAPWVVCLEDIHEYEGERGGGTMLVGFVDRRYSLRSVAKTDHSVSTIFYWRTLDLLYNKRLIRLARAKSDGRRKVRTNHVANCCCRSGSRIPRNTSIVIDDAIIFAKPRGLSPRTLEAIVKAAFLVIREPKLGLRLIFIARRFYLTLPLSARLQLRELLFFSYYFTRLSMISIITYNNVFFKFWSILYVFS